MSRELLNRCKKALIETRTTDISINHHELIAEIDAELANPEPDPAGYVHKMYKTHTLNNGNAFLYPDRQYGHNIPLYIKPQAQQKPLSDGEIEKLWIESNGGFTSTVNNFARAVEKAHGIS